MAASSSMICAKRSAACAPLAAASSASTRFPIFKTRRARRLPELRRFYEVRCRAMLDALAEVEPAGGRWTRPSGGFFILLELAGEIDATEILPQAIDAGVAYVAGQPFFIDGSGANTLRLAYSKETPEKISEGIARLGRVLQREPRAEAV